MTSREITGFSTGLLFGFFLGIATANSEAATWGDYSPAIGPSKQAGMIVWENTKQWVSEWIGLGDGSVWWREPNTGQSNGIEHWTVLNGWYMIKSFEDPGVGVWSADCIKAVLTDINTGQKASLPCTKGHFYTPFLIPSDPYRMQIWGLIAGTNRFYWDASFYPNEKATNNCWVGGPTTLPVIREQENWWDDSGWMDKLKHPIPFNGMTPIEVSVPMAREATLAKGYGVWTLVDLVTKDRMCLYSTWTWQ